MLPPLPVLFSLALTAAGGEPRARGDGAKLSPEVEEEKLVEALRRMVDRVAGPIIAAKDVSAFELAMRAALDDPALQSEVVVLTSLVFQLMQEGDWRDGDLQSTVERYVEIFGEAQRWRIRQVLDMLLEVARDALDVQSNADNEQLDLAGAMTQAAAAQPELTKLLLESTVLNMAAAAALELEVPLNDRISDALMSRWYVVSHQILRSVDPIQEALAVLLREQQAQGKLAAVHRATYQQLSGANDTLVTYVFLVVDRSVSDIDAVKMTRDHRLVWRLQEALQAVEPETAFVAIKVRYADEPGPVEDTLEA